MLTIAFVTGTEPGKWFRRYEEFSGARLSTLPSSDPFPLLTAPGGAGADLALVRLPDPRVGEEYHVVRLYEESAGVAVPKDSVYAEVGEEVRWSDVSGEHLNYAFSAAAPPAEAEAELRSALQVVAANVGIAVGPLPLLRALSKKQVAALPLAAPAGVAAATEVGLVWLKERDADDIQDFVGVAKGRTARSSRGGGDERVRAKSGAQPAPGRAGAKGGTKGRVNDNGHKQRSRNRKRGAGPR